MNLTQLELNHPEEIILKLTDPARPFKDLGEIKVVVTLMPKTQEDKEQVCFAGCQCARIFLLIFIYLWIRGGGLLDRPSANDKINQSDILAIRYQNCIKLRHPPPFFNLFFPCHK